MLMDTAIKKIDGKWYAFGYDCKKYQVYSIGRDCPKDGGLWTAKATDSGIRYVATWSPTRASAYQKAKRHGNYIGEI